MERLKMSHELMRNGQSSGAFNARVLGHTYNEVFGYPVQPRLEEIACFNLADDMFMAGKIYCVQRFKHKAHGEVCKGVAFPYGGTWVCNTCCNEGLDKPWWKVKVYKDGSAWCCVGIDFEDLQSSDCFAFGDTRNEALENYEALMLKHDALPPPPTDKEI